MFMIYSIDSILLPTMKFENQEKAVLVSHCVVLLMNLAAVDVAVVAKNLTLKFTQKSLLWTRNLKNFKSK